MAAIRELPIVKRRAIRRPTDLLFYSYVAAMVRPSQLFSM
jgi:hypothetical protein